MNKVEYNLITNKSEKRKIEILETIATSVKMISCNNYAEQCKVTNKTIAKDFFEIQDQLGDIVKLYYIDKVLHIERVGDPSNIYLVITQMVQKSVLIILTLILFEKGRIGFRKFSDQCFISESTLRDKIKVLKNLLLQFELKLKYNPLEIVGKEINIRYFFFCFFYRSYSKLDNRIHESDMKMLNEMIKYGEKNHFNSLTIDYERMEIWLRITKMRIAQNHLIEFDSTTKNKYMSIISFENFLEVFRLFDSHNKILKHDSDELLYVFISAINSIVYNKKSNYYFNDFSYDFKKYELIVTLFFNKMHLNYRENLNLHTMLKSYLYNIDHLSEFSDLYQKKFDQNYDFVKHNYKNIYETWNFFLEKEFKLKHYEEIALSLTLITISNLKHEIKLLISLKGDSILTDYVANRILNIIPKGYKILFLIDKPEKKEILKSNNLSVCICNYMIKPIEGIDFINVSEMPSDKELQHLSQILINRIGQYRNC